MVSVDDSKSMSESRAVDLAFESIALVSKALTQLDAGQLAITRFGNDVDVVHEFDEPFSTESGSDIIRSFSFQQDVTNVSKLIQSSIEMFTEARALGNQDLWQLQIIISDGICEDHAALRRLVRRAQLERIMIVFVVVDGIAKSGSILDMNQVRYANDESGNMSVKIDRYLDTFPFDFYVIVRNVNELPGVLSSVLRQYFATVSNM
jgi:midasin